ncbi:MAG: hypothetical protein ACE5GS_12060 [Kiloniellaceae bacterium]
MPETPENDSLRSTPGDLRSTVELVANSGGPFQVGDFEVGDDGRLRPREDRGPLKFGFAYLGIEFRAEVHTCPEPRIDLSADLGKLPYTMELGQGRRLTRRILEATATLPGGRISLAEDQDMRLRAAAEPPMPLTPASVMATVTALLLDFKPYLELLRGTLGAPRPEPKGAA